MWAKRCNWSPSGRKQLVEMTSMSVDSILSFVINFSFSLLINIIKRLWQGGAKGLRREVPLPIEIRADVVSSEKLYFADINPKYEIEQIGSCASLQRWRGATEKQPN